LQDFAQESAEQVSASLHNCEKRNSRLLRYYFGVLLTSKKVYHNHFSMLNMPKILEEIY
jgi:hypothetical protein